MEYAQLATGLAVTLLHAQETPKYNLIITIHELGMSRRITSLRGTEQGVVVEFRRCEGSARNMRIGRMTPVDGKFGIMKSGSQRFFSSNLF